MQEECIIWKKGSHIYSTKIQHENNHFSTLKSNVGSTLKFQRCFNFHIQLKINVDSTLEYNVVSTFIQRCVPAGYAWWQIDSI